MSLGKASFQCSTIPNYKYVQWYSSLTKFTDPPKANPSAAQASQAPAPKTKKF